MIIPINWREKIIITIPAKILNTSEFCKSVWPKNDADAPKRTNTVENPKQNKINGKKFIFFCLIFLVKIDQKYMKYTQVLKVKHMETKNL